MSTTLIATAALMGLAGGPHCAAMCGAACGAITGSVGGAPVRIVRAPAAAGGASASEVPVRVGSTGRSVWLFQAGRLSGYTLAGAAAAQAVSSFAWLSQQAAALRPVWLVLHLAVLAWGLTLLVLARQPELVANAGRQLWMRLQPVQRRSGGVFTVGMLWAFMPCGLLYSALLVASLSGGPVQGALAMALFALASGVPLAAAPALLQRLRRLGDGVRKDFGTRASGLVLALAALWGLSMDLAQRIAQWCGF